MVHTTRHRLSTTGQGDTHDITSVVTTAVGASGQRAGIATVFIVGSTAAIMTIEFEPGAIADLNDVLERLAPRQGEYAHHLRWGDDNGSSHVRAALLGSSVTIPFVDGEVALGRWQQVVLLECDTRPRTRDLVVQVVGE